MEAGYREYRNTIKSILTDDNIENILKGSLSSHFEMETCQDIIKSRDKVSKFFEEFDKINNDKKYDDFLSVTNDISDYIKIFLGDPVAAKKAKEKFTLIFKIFRIDNDNYVNSLMLDEMTLHQCHLEKMITDQLFDELRAKLNNKGEINVKLTFFWNINLKSPDCLGKLLWIYHITNTDFISTYLKELHDDLLTIDSEEEQKKKIFDYSSRMLESNETCQAFLKNEKPDEEEEEEEYYDFIVNHVESKGEPLKLRNYQMELAEAGIEGSNVLICSPTGSGKTIVAVKVVEEHLKANPQGKVVFLVHQVSLAAQQAKVFRQYLEREVFCMSGASKSLNTPLRWNLDGENIFILTSDILRNALEVQNENKLSINVFSLILFDECHNVDKKHPYNRIMSHYFADKNKGKSVPQIIGLTASTGTNKAKSKDAALQHLFNLCGNLDTHIVSTVKSYKEELNALQTTPKEEILTPGLRSPDQFEIVLQIQMALCERILQDMDKKGYFTKSPDIQALIRFPEDRFQPKYLNILGKLDTDLYKNTQDANKKSVFVIAEYLKVFYEALKINHLFRAVDAINLIKEKLCSKIGNPDTCEEEKTLKSQLQILVNNPEQYNQSDNPCLEMLKKEIKSQFDSFSDSRIIVFVRDRNFTRILKDIFSVELSFVNCEIVMGNEGLTKNATQEIICQFMRGVTKVLFATTVIEEGQDIPKCNMVIRYGHVTNETSMLQSEGRARAADSKYTVIVPYKLRWQIKKEKINRQRAAIMHEAIEEFQKMDEATIEGKIKECQSERDIREIGDRLNNLSVSNELDTSSTWNFYCKKCDLFICTSKDIRLAEKVHHIVINQMCFKSMKLSETKTKNQCQIQCSQCSNQLGNRQNYKSLLFPNLKISFFTLKCDGSDNVETFKNWKDISFQIVNFDIKELGDFKRNHSLAK